MNKVKMENLLPFIEEAFERNQKFKIPITGTSMNPLLYQGRDFVFIEKPVFPLEIGDIPLYRRDDGTFVLHRVVGKNENGYIMCGDNQYVHESGITDAHLIGLVTSFSRNGEKIDVNKLSYKIYSHLFCCPLAKFLKHVKASLCCRIKRLLRRR